MNLFKGITIAAFLLLAGTVAILAEQTPVSLTEADNGKTVAAKVGQDVVVSLEGNPTTGFGWALTGIEGQAVTLVGKIEYQSHPHPERMTGVDGTFKAKFQAAKPGKATVKLQYHRSWEKNVQPAKTFEISISVEK